MSESQRATVAGKLANMRQGERTDVEPSANLQKVSQTEAAKLLNVSPRSVATAKQVQQKAVPELIEEMQSHIIEGKHETIGLSEKQALSFAKWWYNSYKKQGHNLEHPKFDCAVSSNEKIRKVLENERKRNQTLRPETGNAGTATDRQSGGNQTEPGRESSTDNCRIPSLSERESGGLLGGKNGKTERAADNETLKVSIGEKQADELGQNRITGEPLYSRPTKKGEINLKTLYLKTLYNENGEFNYDEVKNVAGRVGSGEIEITRLKPEEEAGRIAGGRRNVEASIIIGADARANQTASEGRRPTRKEKLKNNARVEEQLEKYARN